MSDLPSSRALPRGFRFASASCGLKKRGHTGSLDVALIVSDAPGVGCGRVHAKSGAGAAGGSFPRARAGIRGRHARRHRQFRKRELLGRSRRHGRFARHGAAALRRLLGCRAQQVVVCSTGVIGVPLPVERILKAAPGLAEALESSPRAFDGLTRAIMTTDTRPKRAAASCRIGGRTVRVAGCAKGAGMIHPNMATMLSFVVTDAAVAPRVLDRALREVVARTFNCISVDGDSSTNDTLLVLANGACGAKKIAQAGGSDYTKFVAALEQVCKTLAIGIVADGEGATHVVEIEVRGAPSDRAATQVAQTIALSSLVKTAHRRR